MKKIRAEKKCKNLTLKIIDKIMSTRILSINGLCHGIKPCLHDVLYADSGKRMSGPEICTALLSEPNWNHLAKTGGNDIVNVILHLGIYLYATKRRKIFQRLLMSLYGIRNELSLVRKMCEHTQLSNVTGNTKIMNSLIESYVEISSLQIDESISGYVYCNESDNSALLKNIRCTQGGAYCSIKVLVELGLYHNMTLIYDGPVHEKIKFTSGIIIGRGCRVVVLANSHEIGFVVKLIKDACGSLDINQSRYITTTIYTSCISCDSAICKYTFDSSMMKDIIIVTNSKFVVNATINELPLVYEVPCSMFHVSENYYVIKVKPRLCKVSHTSRIIELTLTGVSPDCVVVYIGNLYLFEIEHFENENLILPPVY